MTTAILAAVSAGAAVQLLLVPTVRLPRSQTRGRTHGWVIVASAVLATAAAVSLLQGTRLVAGLAGLVAAAGVVRAVQRRQASRARTKRRTLVVEVGEAMVGELRAGRPALHALIRAGEVWSEMLPVVSAARLGGDVPGALRALSRTPGAEGLADLAAAWQVSARSGTALAAALGQVVASARARQHAAALVAGELSSARATAWLVALLPLGTSAMAAGLGAQPWSFLTGHPIGVVCLVGGVVLVLAGLMWIDRIATAVLPR